MANKIQVKRGLLASLPEYLSNGEFGFTTDTKQVFIGDASANYEVLMHKLFGANTIMAANTDDTPAALTIAEQTLVGRITGGDITDLTPAQIMALLSGGAAADFAMNAHKLTGVTDPTADQDAATKAYVDATSQGLKVHAAVECATTGDITLSGEQTLDGILTATDRVLVGSQTLPAQNGIYVSAVGAWARAADLNASDEVAGSFTYVTNGTTLGSTGWACTVDPTDFIIGTTDMPWAQFSSAGYVTASGGLTKTGNDIAPNGVLEDFNTLGEVASDGQVIVGTGAGAFAYESGDTLRTSLGLAIGTDVLAEQTIGIADNNLLEVDGTPLDTEIAVFTATGINGKSKAEAMALLSGGATATFSMNTQLISNILDPVSDQDAATKKWVDTNYGTGVAATIALDNLVSVALNTALLPDAAAADDFGSATLPFKDMWFAGSSGTPGTNNFQITGASTSGTRVMTFPDETGTVLTNMSPINGGAFA